MADFNAIAKQFTGTFMSFEETGHTGRVALQEEG